MCLQRAGFEHSKYKKFNKKEKGTQGLFKHQAEQAYKEKVKDEKVKTHSPLTLHFVLILNDMYLW